MPAIDINTTAASKAAVFMVPDVATAVVFE
jgi:hypothetical protein